MSQHKRIGGRTTALDVLLIGPKTGLEVIPAVILATPPVENAVGRSKPVSSGRDFFIVCLAERSNFS